MFTDIELMPVQTTSDAGRIFGRSEMAERIRALDWSRTPLGALECWPETMRFLVNVALSARHPVLLMLGPEMVQVYNDAFAPILTNRHPAALGQCGRELWKDVWPVVGAQLEAVLNDGRDFLQEQALVPILRNGELSEAYFDYSYSPAFNSDGSIAGIVVICQDVTAHVVKERERAQAESGLRSERGRLLRVLQQAPIVFAVLEGPEHRFTMVNETYSKLVSYREILGRTVAEALPEAVEQGYVEILDRVFTTGEPFVAHDARFSIASKAGETPEERTLDFVYQPLREENGSISGIIVIGADTTERKRTEKALIQSEKLAAVGRLASTIAHEINNPLEAVTNLLFLAQRTTSAEESKGYLLLADEELRRMSVIATQTLQFNKQLSEPRAVKCNELLANVVKIYEGRIRNANVKVEERTRNDEPVLCFDGEIRQVLNNLVSNAIDAMQPHGGRLLLRSRMATDCVTGRAGVSITIADTGPGISKAHVERIFEPFFTTKGASGTGLGLWVSSDIVKRHKGKLRMRSSQNAAHHGSVFTVFLPHRQAGTLR